MTKVTNTAEGPRGVVTKDGQTRFLETADLELHPDHDLYEGVEKGEAAAKKAAKEAAEPEGEQPE